MARLTARLSVSVAWWVDPYLRFRRGWANLTGRVPDVHAISRHIGRGIRVTVK
ncbi:MAG: hypothetical protein GAK28_00136 [Luteibacter sp.]|nr:MAG: hypothetical protein GAK28_00136 [Luteibacter sp.]